MPAEGHLKSGQKTFQKQVTRLLQGNEKEKNAQEWRAASENVGVSLRMSVCPWECQCALAHAKNNTKPHTLCSGPHSDASLKQTLRS